MTYYLEKEEWKYCSMDFVHYGTLYDGHFFFLDDPLEVSHTSYLFGEDNSIRRNIKIYAWNFIIDDIYDLVTYQGTELSGILEFYTLVGELWNYIDIYMVFWILPLEVKLFILLYSFMTALDMVI
jgi:hypothetical protein